MNQKTQSKSRFVVCTRNDGYRAALEVHKVYRTLPDRRASAHGMVRVIDESGEDYLYPGGFFVPIALPSAAVRSFKATG